MLIEVLKMRYILLLALSTIGFNLAATSEQYTIRTEFSLCKYNEGKGYEDVVKYEKRYEKFLLENNLKYTRFILTPILAGEKDYDFVLWGNWPDGEEMYKEYGSYLNDYKKTSMNPSTCKGSYAVFNTGARHLRIPREEYDRIQFVEFANCKFTDNASFEELLAISAEHESLVEEFGYKGYGVHYLRPYRGFEDDLPFDMVRMVHWYNRDTRAENVKQFRPMRKLLQDNGIQEKYAQHIESCGNADVFGMEFIYSSNQ